MLHCSTATSSTAPHHRRSWLDFSHWDIGVLLSTLTINVQSNQLNLNLSAFPLLGVGCANWANYRAFTIWESTYWGAFFKHCEYWFTLMSKLEYTSSHFAPCNTNNTNTRISSASRSHLSRSCSQVGTLKFSNNCYLTQHIFWSLRLLFSYATCYLLMITISC